MAVEIDVILTGAENVTEAFDNIGESSSAMAERFNKDNSKLGEGLGDLTGNVKEMFGSVKGLNQAFKMSGSSMLGMVPAIGAVVAAGFALYETFLNISGAAEEAERAEQAMGAAASDLQSKLEALAEKGVIPTADELQRFTEATIQSQFAKEQLQTSMERKVTPAMENYNELLREQRKLQKLINKDTGASGAVYLEATKRLPELDKELAKAKAKLTAKLSEYREEQVQVEKDIRAAAKQEEEFAERSNEARIAKIKENKTRLDAIELTKAQITQTELEAKVTENLIKQRRQLFDLTLEQAKEDDNEQFIKDLNDRLKSQIKGINQARIIEEKGIKDRAEIRKIAREKEQAEQEKERSRRQARAQAMRAKRQAEERQLQSELARIRELGYEQLRLEGVETSELLEMRYEDELRLAGNNQNLKLIAEMKYQNAVARLHNEAEQEAQARRTAIEQAEQDSLNRRFEEERRQAQQRANFIFDTLEFDAQQIEDQTARELALLDLRYKKEISLNQHTQTEITEIQRREAIERQKILDSSFVESMDTLKSMSKDLLKESTSAIYQSLVDAGQFDLTFEELKHDFDQKVGQAREEMLKAQASNDVALYQQKEEEITNLTAQYESQRKQIRAQEAQTIPLLFGNILKGLGQQASVEAIMELAKGFSKLGSPLTAGFAPAHFKASAIFAGVAATAGVGGAILTNNANTAISRAGRGGGGTVSPTGTPQTATTPEREQAETSSMVFNINFGGAVIYDTKKSAEQALADRITNIQNTRRRGAPRRGAM